jgi:hypothetical protein
MKEKKLTSTPLPLQQSKNKLKQLTSPPFNSQKKITKVTISKKNNKK